jgi:hypothetical protein
MSVVAHGIDTVRVVWEAQEPLPITDVAWNQDMRSRGFTRNSKQRFDEQTQGMVESVTWSAQSKENRTLRLFLWGARYLIAEFSAPRWLDRSIINLHLVTAQEALELIYSVETHSMTMIPGLSKLDVAKLRRVDYAVDVEVGSATRDWIKAFKHMPLKGSRDVDVISYLNQGVRLEAATQTLTVYPKGIELKGKLSTKERKQHAQLLKKLTDTGVIRIEHQYKPRGGLPISYLNEAAGMLAEKLRYGFQAGHSFATNDLRELLAQVDALPETWNTRNNIFAFAVRSEVQGTEYIKDVVPKRTVQRWQQLSRKYGLRFDESARKPAKVDVVPVIEDLMAA